MVIAAVLAKKHEHLYLGNLEAKRDWGFAPEYVEAMHKMLQNDEAEDFVIGTGKSYTVREFVEEAFNYVGLEWKGYVKIDPEYFRPTEVEELIADTTKAFDEFGFKAKTKLELGLQKTINWYKKKNVML